MKKCLCNICSLPKAWRKALNDLEVQVWSSGMESSDMGIEFGVDSLIDFVEAVKDSPIPKKPEHSKKNMAELKTLASDISDELNHKKED